MIADRSRRGKGWAHVLLYEEPVALRRGERAHRVDPGVLERVERARVRSACSPRRNRRRRQAARRGHGPARAGWSSGRRAERRRCCPRCSSIPSTARARRRAGGRAQHARRLGSAGRRPRHPRRAPEGRAGRRRVSARPRRTSRPRWRTSRPSREKINDGEGTVGALIADPTVYERLVTILDGAQRSFLLRGLLRSLGKGGEAAKALEERQGVRWRARRASIAASSAASPAPSPAPARTAGALPASSSPLVEERAAPAPSGVARALAAGSPPDAAQGRRDGGGRPRAHRHRRARSRAGRRGRAGLARADRRRSGHRQEHAAAPGAPGRSARAAPPVLYVSAEESAAQVKMRADRLGIAARRAAAVGRERPGGGRRPSSTTIKPRVLVIDSIQTVFLPELESAPGSVAQVRECGARLMTLAKGRGIATFLVGHVTKEGALAGPRVLEHLVDTVLYFEGEQPSRLPRAARGQEPLRLDQRDRRLRDGRGRARRGAEPVRLLPRRASGATRRARSSSRALEGTRPLLLELQALVSRGLVRHAAAHRARRGLQPRLPAARGAGEARGPAARQPGRVRQRGRRRPRRPSRPPISASIIAAASSYLERPVRGDVLVLGEVGLTGEVRAVNGVEARLRAAAAARLQVGDRPAQQRRRRRCRCRSRRWPPSATRSECCSVDAAPAGPAGCRGWRRAGRRRAGAIVRRLARGRRRRGRAGRSARDRGRGRSRRGADADARVDDAGRRRRPADRLHARRRGRAGGRRRGTRAAGRVSPCSAPGSVAWWPHGAPPSSPALRAGRCRARRAARHVGHHRRPHRGRRGRRLHGRSPAGAAHGRARELQT